METRAFREGAVIFRQGDKGDCLYDVYQGRVGIYADYGTEREQLLAEYYTDQFFGEMGLLDRAPRSATAVALEDTTLGIITEETFGEYFRSKPGKVLLIMQQLSQNLRRRTNDYFEVCRSIHELAEKEGIA